MNYNEEQTKRIVEAYQSSPNRETVEALAKELSKSIKSIIGKLSREGVYRRETTRPRLENYLLQKWRSFQISLMILGLKWKVYWVWRKHRKQH